MQTDVRPLKVSSWREHIGSLFFLQISLLETWTTCSTPRATTPAHFCILLISLILSSQREYECVFCRSVDQNDHQRLKRPVLKHERIQEVLHDYDEYLC